MKKKRAIRNYVLTSIFIVIMLVLTFISFPVPGTTKNFVGLGNLHLGLELGGGVKNTYELEVADWYEGDKQEAYVETVNRVQNLLNKKYADAKVYLNGDDKITVEVPDTSISTNYLVGFIEMKSAEGEDAEAKVTGQDIAKVEYMLSGTTHGVYIEFTEEGKEKFAALTKEVSGSDSQTMYIYMDKNYETAFSQPTVTEENTLGYTFISGASIVSKSTGKEYANKLESARIGVNMKTDLDDIEVVSVYGDNVKLVMTIVTIAVVVATIVLAYIMYKQGGLVSTLSLLFALMLSVLISAICDMQITFGGWIGFIAGYMLNFALHMYYLKVIKSEYNKGKKLNVAFTSGYKRSLFNTLDILLLTLGTVLSLLIIPSSIVRMFVYNFLMTIAGTALTSLLLNKVFLVNYTAFNYKNEKKLNFRKEEVINEAE